MLLEEVSPTNDPILLFKNLGIGYETAADSISELEELSVKQWLRKNFLYLPQIHHQIIITPGTFSAGGDSGSLIVADAKGKNASDRNKPVGLLFAGSDLFTIANPIDAVLSRFGVSIDGE